MTALLAHQGGWDEIALIAGPILVVGVLIFLARRRQDDEDDGDGGNDGDGGETST